MKKLLLAIAAVMMVSSTAFAQEQREHKEKKQLTKEAMVQMQTNRMAEELGLDDTQKAALQTLNTEYMDKMTPMMRPRGERNDSVQRTRPTEEEMQTMKKQFEESQQAYNAELKKILTEEQYAKYEKEQANRRQRGPQGRFHGQGRERGDGSHQFGMDRERHHEQNAEQQDEQ